MKPRVRRSTERVHPTHQRPLSTLLNPSCAIADGVCARRASRGESLALTGEVELGGDDVGDCARGMVPQQLTVGRPDLASVAKVVLLGFVNPSGRRPHSNDTLTGRWWMSKRLSGGEERQSNTPGFVHVAEQRFVYFADGEIRQSRKGKEA